MAFSGWSGFYAEARQPDAGMEHLPKSRKHAVMELMVWKCWSPVTRQFLLGVKLGPDQFTPPSTVCPPVASMASSGVCPRARNEGVGYCSNRSSVRSRPWPLGKGLQAEINVHAVGEFPGQHPARCPVHHGDQIQKAPPHRNLGDVRTPDIACLRQALIIVW